MDARTALKNYNDTMVKTYGANYVEHWTEDDRETFEILARKASAEFTERTAPVQPNWKRSAYLRRVLGIREDVKSLSVADREAAWKEHAAEYGNGVSGVMRRSKDAFGNWIVVTGEDRTQRERSERFRKSKAFVTGVTAADLLASVKNG